MLTRSPLQRALLGLWTLLAIAACLCLMNCAGVSSGGGSNGGNNQQGGGGNGGGGNQAPGDGIPDAYWGLIVHRLKSFPLQLPYGQFRGWDSGGGQWPDLEPCAAQTGSPDDPCFTWDKFDTQMNALQQNGINDVLYTLSRTPLWAVNLSGDPTGQQGTECDYYSAGSNALDQAAGQCLLPIDLNPDGTGTDQMWKDWVAAIATRVNDPTYLQSHAHIKYWEPWNEFHRSTTVNNYAGSESFEGTYAQLVRMTEDLRCTITGKGVIHNYPKAGASTTCTASAIDATAVIVSPSSGTDGGLYQTQNFLYCNASGANAPASNTFCTTGSAGSQAVDIIDEHLYANSTTPEVVAQQHIPSLRGILSSPDLAKPLINGEGSWGNVSHSNVIWTDPYAQAGFIPRFFALYWSAGVTMSYWYGYDDTLIGALEDPSNGALFQPAATAWQLTYSWLAGAKPVNSPFCSNQGTVYTCDFTESNGKKAELVWDAQYGQNCSQMAQPILCGSTGYSVPSQFNQDWIDLQGSSHPAASSVTIGANPILLEGQ